MEHYVTLFDIGFAPQGLALQRSLQRHAGEHTLWVLCMDDEVLQLLRALALPNVKLVSLSEVEDARLLAVKPSRTRAEYCWTLTPFTHDIVFDRDSRAQRVTYIDADMWLRGETKALFHSFEASGAAVQITEHAYAPENDQSATSGRFCVQFLTMDRERSISVRHWWQDQCIDWCFARVEDGKFGDQKYLDDWPSRFGDLIHVAEPKGMFQGPWNATRFPYGEGLTYHFHSLRIARYGFVRPVNASYLVPRALWLNVYLPYLEELAEIICLIADTLQMRSSPQIGLRQVVIEIFRSRLIRAARKARPPFQLRSLVKRSAATIT